MRQEIRANLKQATINNYYASADAGEATGCDAEAGVEAVELGHALPEGGDE